MIFFYSDFHIHHNPPHEIFNGQKEPHSEIATRAENIKKALVRNGHTLSKITSPLPSKLLEKVHSKSYLKFMKSFCEEIKDNTYFYPSVFFYRGGHQSKSVLAQFGNYSFDMYTPLSKQTYKIALESAACSYSAALLVKSGKTSACYALCRPPGHHAQKDQMGGYCYINNAAVAAEFLSESGKVALLDIDFHHGNGTQEIFYKRGDVFTQSIHADPNWKFPFFSGFEDEIGESDGRGLNRNFPLPQGTSNVKYDQTLKVALGNIKKYQPKYLVVSLGEDIHTDDPIGGFKLTTNYFNRMAKELSTLKLPTVIVQEGGYNTNKLGDNVNAFLSGFNST